VHVDARPVAVPQQDFSLVYGRWMPSLTRYCRSILRNDADAQDAAQNAMLKAMHALATGPAPEQLPPWLHRIARNEAISLMRCRRDAVALEDHHETAGPTTEEVVATRRRLGDLLADLQALPERQREALVLRELDGLSHRGIAAQLGITEGAAQQAVLDARRSLHAFADGRALECDRVQSWLSAHEHARLRSRGVRAHLRDCGSCSDFAAALRTRPRDLAALLPVAGAGGLLARIAALFAGGPVGAKVALGLGVLATAGAGLALEPPGAVTAPPDPRPAAVAPAGAHDVTGITATAAGSGGATGANRTAGSRVTHARRGSQGDRRTGDGATSKHAAFGVSPAAGAAPVHAASAPTDGGSGSGSGHVSEPSSSTPAGSTPAPSSGTTVVPSAPKPVADALAPVVQAVDEVVAPVVTAVQDTVTTVTSATDHVGGTVQGVVDQAAATDPTGTVGKLTGGLTGGG